MLGIKSTARAVVRMKTNRTLFFVYIGVDILVIIGSLFLGDLWLLNTQVAFMCSMIITLASFVAYKSMVHKRVSEGDLGDDRELLDTIEDPHSLHEEEEAEETLPPPRKVGVKQSMKNLFTSYKGALSPYRLASYGVLCLSVLFLIRHGYFDAVSFLVGLGIVPISSLIGLGIIDKKEEYA